MRRLAQAMQSGELKQVAAQASPMLSMRPVSNANTVLERLRLSLGEEGADDLITNLANFDLSQDAGRIIRRPFGDSVRSSGPNSFVGRTVADKRVIEAIHDPANVFAEPYFQNLLDQARQVLPLGKRVTGR